MDQNKTDLVMKFTLTPGNDVPAECALGVAPGDALMTDFQAADYQNYSNYFEVIDFDMKVGLNPDDDSHKTSMVTPHTTHAAHLAKNTSTDAWGRWRSATAEQARKIAYPFKFESASFERIIDRASPVFFQSCCTSQTFDSAVLVKRLSQGELPGSNQVSVGYLRIDFGKVLITDINWEDGDLVKEKCDFTCQSFKLTYLKQSNAGRIGGSMPSGLLAALFSGARPGNYSAIWPNPNGPNHQDRTLDIRGGGRRS